MKKIFSPSIILLVMLLTMLTVFTPTSTVPTEAEINQAISLGMQWLAGQQSVDGSWGTVDQVGKTGFAVLKFETHAVGMEEDPLDPAHEYYDQVRSGLDYIFANASTMEISMQPAGDPDTDGDGIGVYFGGLPTYETGIAMMAIAASTHPEMVVSVLGSSVDGWTYEEVLQDAVDYLAFGQTDVGNGRGGWYYEEIDNGEGLSDNSNTGYAVLGLAYAEAAPPYGFGLTIPAFVKGELDIWIDYIQNDVGLGDPTDDGGSGYEHPDSMVNILKTGHLLCEMAFVGARARATQRVIDAVNYIVRHWYDANVHPGWKGSPAENASYQAMYTTMTGLEALGIDEIDGIDWFNEFSDVLVTQQNPNGSWPSSTWDDGEQILATEWALLTLQKAFPPPLTRRLVEEWRYPMFYYDWGWFGSSPAIADLGPDVNNSGTEPDSDLEIITGSDEEYNYYWELGADAYGIWRSLDSGGNLEWAKDTETDEARSSPAVIDIDGDGDLEIAGGTTSGWYVEVMNHTGGFVWTFPTLCGFYVSGPFVWPSSPAVADVDASVSGLEVIIGNNWLGNVWAFDGDNTDEIDEGITIAYSDYPWVDIGENPLPLGNEGTDWDVLWVFNTTGSIISSPAVGDVDNDATPEVVIGSTDGNVYVLDGPSGSLEHAFITGGAVCASAALADLDADPYLEMVIGSTDGNIYCLEWNDTSGSVEWAYSTGGAIFSSAAIGDIDGDLAVEIVVGSSDGNVYSLSASGVMEWSYPTGGAVFSSPALADVVDVSKYAKDWPMFRNNPSRTGLYGMAPPTCLDVYVGSDDGFLYLLDGDDGSLIDRFQAYEAIHTSPSVADIDGDYKLEILFYDWGTSSTRGGHTFWCVEDTGWVLILYDVAVTDVTPSKTVVGQEFSVPINVTVENQGNFPETFNVTAYYSNETLTPEHWETFWSMGDVNRDGYIDDIDGDLISAAYDSYPGHPRWNPDADLDQDGDVDADDFNIWVWNYGWDIWSYFNILRGSIGTQTVNDLSPGNSTTITLTWNTTGVPYDKYTISAYATPVAGEIDIDDNTLVDGTVFVTITGDVSGDGAVNRDDLDELNEAYGSEPGDPNWNPNCDINNDGKVDASDLFDLSENYGKTI